VYQGENGNGSSSVPFMAAPRYFTAGMPRSRNAHHPIGIRQSVTRLKKLPIPFTPKCRQTKATAAIPGA
jgi:hypothetical protein